jgi:hypothetical protein
LLLATIDKSWHKNASRTAAREPSSATHLPATLLSFPQRLARTSNGVAVAATHNALSGGGRTRSGKRLAEALRIGRQALAPAGPETAGRAGGHQAGEDLAVIALEATAAAPVVVVAAAAPGVVVAATGLAKAAATVVEATLAGAARPVVEATLAEAAAAIVEAALPKTTAAVAIVEKVSPVAELVLVVLALAALAALVITSFLTVQQDAACSGANAQGGNGWKALVTGESTNSED